MGNDKFDFFNPWRVSDLPEEIRRVLEEENDLELGATYIGGKDSDIIFEVPHCPYCGIGFYKTHRCKHLVCVYDSTNGEYIEIDPLFKDYALKFKDKLALKQAEFDDESAEEILLSYSNGQFPLLSVLGEIIEGFKYHEVYDVWGAHGKGCGYANDDLLLRCYTFSPNKNS